MKKLIIIIICFTVNFANSQESYVPTKENIEARKWFNDARFGLFIPVSYTHLRAHETS